MSILSRTLRGIVGFFIPSIPKIPPVISHIDVQQQLESDYNVPVCYGEAGLPGNIIFYNTTGDNNKYLDIIILVSEGEIEGFTKVFMDDAALPLFDAGAGNTLTAETGLEATDPLFGALKADGTLIFQQNMSDSKVYDYLQVGSTFSYCGTDFARGATLSLTLDNLVTYLNGSSDSEINVATYTKTDAGDGIYVEYDTAGTVGNSHNLISRIEGFTIAGEFVDLWGNATLSGGRDSVYVSAYFYNGSDSQTANAQLITDYPPTSESSGWTSNHRLQGFSYMYVRLLHNLDLFSGGIPQFKFELKGNKVYDSRLDTTNGGSGTHREDVQSTWEYSDNPALCLRDYITNGRYGKDLVSSAVGISSIAAAADDCDVLKNGLDLVGDPITYKTYTIGAVVDTAKKVKNNVDLFLQTMNGSLPYFNGTYSLNILQAGNATVTLNEDNIIGGVSLTAPSKNDRFNKVWVTFPDRDFHFDKGDAPFDSATYLSEDNDQILEKRIDAPYINYYPQAMDLAELTMNLSRRGLGVSLTTTQSVLEEVAGGIVDLTYEPFGYTDKEFRLEKITIRDDGLCDIELSEHDDSFYTLTEQQEQEGPSETSLIDPRNVLKPTIISIVSDVTSHLVSVDGVITPRIYVEWTNQDAYPSTYLIYAKLSTDSNFVEVGQVNVGNVESFYISNIEWGASYDVGVAVRNGAGYVSPIAISSITTPNPSTERIYTYPNVTGLELVGAGTDQGQGNSEEFTGQDIRLQWRLSSDSVTFEYGSDDAEAAGGGGIVPLTLSGYRIEIYHPGDTEARQEYFTTDPNFTYTYDKNFEDGEGAASRSVSFEIWAFGSVAGTGSTGESESPALLSASNPQPSLPTAVSVSGGFQHIDLSFTAPNDNDYAGVKVWLSTSTGFTPSDSTLVYSGPDNKIQITGLDTGTEYYLIFAPFDGFGSTGITQSSEYLVVTQAIISADLDTTAPTVPGSLVLSSSVQESKLYVKSSITATWTASTDDGLLSGYSVQYWDDVDSTTVEAFTTSLEYVVTDAVVGRIYSVRVKAKDWASNESEWTPTQTQVAAGDTDAVANVTGLTATAGLKKVILDWINPTAEGYLTTNIYRGIATGVYGSTPIYVGMGDTFVDSDVDTGTEYFYVLSTNSVSQVESPQTSEVSATPDTITSSNATEYIAAAAIDADRIVANSITANEIDANTITGNEITGTTLSGIFVDAGTLTAGTINGLTIQTSATAPTTGGVTMTSTGVKGFNTSGTLTSHIKTDGTGFLGLTNPIQWDASGVVTVPGTIIAGEIVGNTIKTDTTGYRVEMSSSAPFTYWNGTTTLVELDSAGNASFEGTMTIGTGSTNVVGWDNTATSNLGLQVIPAGMNVGGYGNVLFTKNQIGDGSANDGEIRVQGDSYYHPDGTTRTVVTNKAIYTPYESATTQNPFYVMFTDVAPITRFGGTTTEWPVLGTVYFVVVIYDADADQWKAVANNGTTYNFTPLDTDALVARGWKDSVTGGIDGLASLLGVNTDMPDDGADVTIDAVEADLTVSTGGIEIDAIASIRAGKTSASSTTAGFWLGYDGVTSGKYDFHIGDANSSLWWDHSAATLKITGELVGATGTFSGALSAATGTFSGTITGGLIRTGASGGNVTMSGSTNTLFVTDEDDVTIATLGDPSTTTTLPAVISAVTSHSSTYPTSSLLYLGAEGTGLGIGAANAYEDAVATIEIDDGIASLPTPPAAKATYGNSYGLVIANAWSGLERQIGIRTTAIDRGIEATGGEVGGRFDYDAAGHGPIMLSPSTSASAPSHTAYKGTLWVTSAGALCINTDSSTNWDTLLTNNSILDFTTYSEQVSTPASPSAGSEFNMYMSNDKIVIQYNHTGTIKYYYLDLTAGTAVWTYSTTAP